jgi:hypothetical protein
MGAIDDAVPDFAQSLLDATGGSVQGANRALSLSEALANVALLPKEERDDLIRKMQPIVESRGMDFEEFRTSLLDPVLQKYDEVWAKLQPNVSSLGPSTHGARVEKYPGTDPYAPCPCNSGRKYKFCCRG